MLLLLPFLTLLFTISTLAEPLVASMNADTYAEVNLTTTLYSRTPYSATRSFIVFSPQILYPKTHVTWRAGTWNHVDWDTSYFPSELHANATGKLLLGYMTESGENLDIGSVLKRRA